MEVLDPLQIPKLEENNLTGSSKMPKVTEMKNIMGKLRMIIEKLMLNSEKKIPFSTSKFQFCCQGWRKSKKMCMNLARIATMILKKTKNIKIWSRDWMEIKILITGNKIGGKMGKIQGKMDKTEDKMDRIGGKMDKMEEKMDKNLQILAKMNIQKFAQQVLKEFKMRVLKDVPKDVRILYFLTGSIASV